jgi:hypothetical protein
LNINLLRAGIGKKTELKSGVLFYCYDGVVALFYEGYRYRFEVIPSNE